jgi:hypothetical protein
VTNTPGIKKNTPKIARLQAGINLGPKHEQNSRRITELQICDDYRIIIKIQFGINISKTVVREKVPTQTAISQAMQKCDNINSIGKIHDQSTTQRSP